MRHRFGADHRREGVPPMRMRGAVLVAVMATFVGACNPLARLGFLPTMPEPAPASDATCSRNDCVVAPKIIEPDSPVSLWSVRLEGGTLKLPSSEMADWYGLVLSGDLVVPGCGRLSQYQAFRASGSQLNLTGDARLVVGVAANGPLPNHPFMPPSHEGVSRCEKVDLASLPDIRWADDAMHARMAFRDGRAYFGLLYADADVGAPMHVHASEWEVVYVLDGSGEVTAGDSIGPLMKGATFAFAPGERHGFESDGRAPTIAVQMYSPPGPERRFLDVSP